MKDKTWIVFLAALLAAVAPLSLRSDANESSDEGELPAAAYDIAGTWVGSSPAIPGVYSFPVRTTQSITPTDPSGKRFTGVNQPANGEATFGGMFPDANHIPDTVATYLRTGPRTYRFTMVQHVVKSQAAGPPFDRGQILYFWVCNGTIDFLDANTKKENGILSVYSNVERPGLIVPPFGINGVHDQDKNDDGLADAGEAPFLCLPFELTYRRLPIMAPCTP